MIVLKLFLHEYKKSNCQLVIMSLLKLFIVIKNKPKRIIELIIPITELYPPVWNK